MVDISSDPKTWIFDRLDSNLQLIGPFPSVRTTKDSDDSNGIITGRVNNEFFPFHLRKEYLFVAHPMVLEWVITRHGLAYGDDPIDLTFFLDDKNSEQRRKC